MGDRSARINTTQLRSLLELPDGASLVEEILSVFRGHIESRIHGLEQALRRKDAADVQRRSHQLKSAASYLGARVVSEACSRLETAAATGALEECGEITAQLRTECLDAAEKIGEYLSREAKQSKVIQDGRNF